ncbi:hypothetical protein, partial [Pseudomonas syringae]|uniref:hypothetical protein n=1 Tax=Pseudomonas syringae TaxID=317 RepID=UPI001F45330A
DAVSAFFSAEKRPSIRFCSQLFMTPSLSCHWNFPAARAGPCSENGASSTRFNDMKKKIRNPLPTATALGSAKGMG